jgi:hypothetical protein
VNHRQIGKRIGPNDLRHQGAYRLHFHDARIVHMAGRYKPWEPRPPTLFEQAPSLAKFYELWQQLEDLMPKSASSDAAASSNAF